MAFGYRNGTEEWQKGKLLYSFRWCSENVVKQKKFDGTHGFLEAFENSVQGVTIIADTLDRPVENLLYLVDPLADCEETLDFCNTIRAHQPCKYS